MSDRSRPGHTPQVTFSKVNPDDSRRLTAISELHIELLPFGPMAELGFRFIRDIGYKVHLRDNLLEALLCEVDGRPAGFIAYTSRSISFHRASVGDHWLCAGLAVIRAIMADPRRFSGLVRSLKMVASRRREHRHGEDPLGEVISLAVRHDFLSRTFIQQSGVWITGELIERAFADLRNDGCMRVRMLVDEDNKAPLVTYHRMGARFEPYDHGGEPNIQVWFDLDEPLAETAVGSAVSGLSSDGP